MSESEGSFRAGCGLPHACRSCKKSTATCQLWVSNCGSYEDYKFTCGDCGYVWWVDGADS